MFFSLFYLVIRLLLRFLTPGDKLERSTEAELLVLRHQLKVLRRQVSRPHLRPKDRVLLAAASRLIPRNSWWAFMVTPQTLLRWHRELVRRKWTYRRRRQGRPPIPAKVQELIVSMAKDNRRWGYQRIRGELRKLGIQISAGTVRNVLLAHGLGPSARRKGPTWRQFLKAQADGIVACDFLTVETIWLRTLHMLFFIHLKTRKILATAVSSRPDSAWVAQQARNLVMAIPKVSLPRFLLRDRDSKYSGIFDEVFLTEGAKVLRSPIRAPKANAYAERWVRTLRGECLDHLLILSRRHLVRILDEFVSHYNAGRPHRGLGLATPEPRQEPPSTNAPNGVRRFDVLGGLIHEYELAA